MIGRVIEEGGSKIVQTLAGATAGTVCKVNYGVNQNYTIPLTPNEAGEGYVGISCVCLGPYYNPATGTLTVDNICSTSSNAECSDKVKSNSLTGDTVYNMAMWCATSDGCYNSMGFSGGRSITYNPYTATLNACCLNTGFACISSLCLTSSCGCPAGNLVLRDASGCLYASDTISTHRCDDPTLSYAQATNLTVTGNTNLTNLTVANTICGSVSGCSLRASCIADPACPDSVYARVECNNELNIVPSSGNYIWLNHRYGVNTIYIGDGSGTNSCGTIVAACFRGNATSATGTSTSNNYCLNYWSNNTELSLALTNTLYSSATGYTGVVGRSTGCGLTYNPSTGLLRIKDSSGCTAGTIRAECICAGCNGIRTDYDINGYCLDDGTHTWYIYCDGSACFGCNVYVCGCLEVEGYDVVTEGTIGNYLTCQCRVSLETYLACSSLCSNVLYLVY